MTPSTPRPRPVPLPIVPEQPAWISYEGLLSPMTPGYQLHPVLRPPSLSSKIIMYNLEKPPSMIIFDGGYTPRVLSMSATTPPIKQLRIMLPTTPALPVVVCNSAGITVSDILNSLYNTLNSPITPSLWDDLNLPPLIVTSPPVTPIRSYSYEEYPLETWPKLKAERKIDLLEGNTIFEGLEAEISGAWKLQTTHLPL